MFRNMATTLLLHEWCETTLPKAKENPYISPEGLWQHSLAVATIMKELGKKYGDGNDKDRKYKSWDSNPNKSNKG